MSVMPSVAANLSSSVMPPPHGPAVGLGIGNAIAHVSGGGPPALPTLPAAPSSSFDATEWSALQALLRLHAGLDEALEVQPTPPVGLSSRAADAAPGLPALLQAPLMDGGVSVGVPTAAEWGMAGGKLPSMSSMLAGLRAMQAQQMQPAGEGEGQPQSALAVATAAATGVGGTSTSSSSSNGGAAPPPGGYTASNMLPGLAQFGLPLPFQAGPACGSRAPSAADRVYVPSLRTPAPLQWPDDAELEKFFGTLPVRKGKWMPAEEAYTARIIEDFGNGMMALEEGTTLRHYLSQVLHCDPMRITKKFAGRSSIGKQVYRPSVAGSDYSPSMLQRLTAEKLLRDELRRRFLVEVRDFAKAEARLASSRKRKTAALAEPVPAGEAPLISPTGLSNLASLVSLVSNNDLPWLPTSGTTSLVAPVQLPAVASASTASAPVAAPTNELDQPMAGGDDDTYLHTQPAAKFQRTDDGSPTTTTAVSLDMPLSASAPTILNDDNDDDDDDDNDAATSLPHDAESVYSSVSGSSSGVPETRSADATVNGASPKCESLTDHALDDTMPSTSPVAPSDINGVEAISL